MSAERDANRSDSTKEVATPQNHDIRGRDIMSNKRPNGLREQFDRMDKRIAIENKFKSMTHKGPQRYVPGGEMLVKDADAWARDLAKNRVPTGFTKELESLNRARGTNGL